MIISDILVQLLLITKTMLPFLFLGFFLAGLIHEYIPTEKILKHFGRKAGIKSILYAILLGLPIPVCVVPALLMGIEFHKKGASLGSVFAFLITGPITSVTALLVLLGLFHWTFVLSLVILIILTALIVGIIINNVNFSLVGKLPKHEKAKIETEKKGKRFVNAIRHGFLVMGRNIAPYIITGFIIASIITVLFSRSMISVYLGKNIFSLFIALIISLPLLTHPVGSVPFVAALVSKGMSIGSALVFFIAGPSTNLPAILVMKKFFGWKILLLFVTSLSACAIILGYILNFIL